MMQTTPQNVIVVPRYDGSIYPNYSKKASTILGVFNLVNVFALFIVNIVGIVMTQNYVDSVKGYNGVKFIGTMVSTLIGCALCLPAGICAIAAGVKGNKGPVIASMVLNAIVAINAVISVVRYVAVIPKLHTALAVADKSSKSIYNPYTRTRDNPALHHFLVAILIIFYLTFFVLLAETIVTIWTSAIGYKVTFYGRTNPVGQPVVMTTTGAPVVIPMHGQQAQPYSNVVSGGDGQQGAHPQNKDRDPWWLENH